MSKRAEEAAIKAYEYGRHTFVDSKREAFIRGYEQAEKDALERALKWLDENAGNYNESESAYDHHEEEMIALVDSSGFTDMTKVE